ncbi:MAG: hypothetical protein ACYC27_19770 [Armatimonadota bacterium]
MKVITGILVLIGLLSVVWLTLISPRSDATNSTVYSDSSDKTIANPVILHKSSGRIIFLRTAVDGSSSFADILETNLATGQTETLITLMSLPGQYETRPASASASPDGKYLHIVGSSGWVFKNKDTGKTTSVFGKTVTYDAGNPPVATIDSSDWCWERGKDALTNIVPPSKCTGPDWSTNHSPMLWSPKENKLLCRRDFNNSPFNTCLYVYDAKSMTTRVLSHTRVTDIAIWSGNGNGIIDVCKTNDGEFTVLYADLSGKTRQLFRWPRKIISLAQSPDNSMFALSDANGCYLLNARRRVITKLEITKLEIPIQIRSFDVSFRFNSSGSRLAVLTSYSYGEPGIGLDQQLWIVDIKVRKASKVAQWQESFMGSALATRRRIENWFTDQKTVIIAGAISYGEEKPVDSENDWVKIWTYDTQSPIYESLGIFPGNETEVFDSGKGCLGVAWWAGK